MGLRDGNHSMKATRSSALPRLLFGGNINNAMQIARPLLQRLAPQPVFAAKLDSTSLYGMENLIARGLHHHACKFHKGLRNPISQLMSILRFQRPSTLPVPLLGWSGKT